METVHAPPKHRTSERQQGNITHGHLSSKTHQQTQKTSGCSGSLVLQGSPACSSRSKDPPAAGKPVHSGDTARRDIHPQDVLWVSELILKRCLISKHMQPTHKPPPPPRHNHHHHAGQPQVLHRLQGPARCRTRARPRLAALHAPTAPGQPAAAHQQVPGEVRPAGLAVVPVTYLPASVSGVASCEEASDDLASAVMTACMAPQHPIWLRLLQSTRTTSHGATAAMMTQQPLGMRRPASGTGHALTAVLQACVHKQYALLQLTRHSCCAA